MYFSIVVHAIFVPSLQVLWSFYTYFLKLYTFKLNHVLNGVKTNSIPISTANRIIDAI